MRGFWVEMYEDPVRSLQVPWSSCSSCQVPGTRSMRAVACSLQAATVIGATSGRVWNTGPEVEGASTWHGRCVRARRPLRTQSSAAYTNSSRWFGPTCTTSNSPKGPARARHKAECGGGGRPAARLGLRTVLICDCSGARGRRLPRPLLSCQGRPVVYAASLIPALVSLHLALRLTLPTCPVMFFS